MVESPFVFSLDYVESIVPQVAEILPPLNDVLTVARWLAEITGRDQADVRRRLLTECDSVGRNVCNAATEFGLVPHVWNERMLEFYGVTDAFLFETDRKSVV